MEAARPLHDLAAQTRRRRRGRPRRPAPRRGEQRPGTTSARFMAPLPQITIGASRASRQSAARAAPRRIAGGDGERDALRGSPAGRSGPLVAAAGPGRRGVAPGRIARSGCPRRARRARGWRPRRARRSPRGRAGAAALGLGLAPLPAPASLLGARCPASRALTGAAAARARPGRRGGVLVAAPAAWRPARRSSRASLAVYALVAARGAGPGRPAGRRAALPDGRGQPAARRRPRRSSDDYAAGRYREFHPRDARAALPGARHATARSTRCTPWASRS